MVEHHLAKVNVDGSSPFTRSKLDKASVMQITEALLFIYTYRDIAHSSNGVALRSSGSAPALESITQVMLGGSHSGSSRTNVSLVIQVVQLLLKLNAPVGQERTHPSTIASYVGSMDLSKGVPTITS